MLGRGTAEGSERYPVNTTEKALVEVRDLVKYFPIRRGVFSRVIGNVKAVDGVSFDIHKGETLGLVGESGCGKTTAGRTLLKLLKPTGGEVRFKGVDLFSIGGAQLRRMRQQMQIIFQDPYGSLNPRMTVDGIVGESLAIHGLAVGRQRRDRVRELLIRVGLPPDCASRYPHEFSGGQRQRIGIARALAVSPEFIVCDEAVSALDVSIQAQIINLLKKIQREDGLSYLFIAHDLSVVEHISDRVAVMYLGLIVEMAECDELHSNPLHPYTQALLSAVPEPDPNVSKERIILEGNVPSPSNPPSGCHFHPRCSQVMDRCKTERVPLYDVGGHQVRCFLAEEQPGFTIAEAARPSGDNGD